MILTNIGLYVLPFSFIQFIPGITAALEGGGGTAGGGGGGAGGEDLSQPYWDDKLQVTLIVYIGMFNRYKAALLGRQVAGKTREQRVLAWYATIDDSQGKRVSMALETLKKGLRNA